MRAAQEERRVGEQERGGRQRAGGEVHEAPGSDTDKVEALPQPDDVTVACGITLFGGPQAKALEVILVRLFPGKGNGRLMYTKPL